MSPKKLTLEEARKMFLGDNYSSEEESGKAKSRRSGRSRGDGRDTNHNVNAQKYDKRTSSSSGKDWIEKKIELLEKELMFGDVSPEREQEIMEKISELEAKIKK